MRQLHRAINLSAMEQVAHDLQKKAVERRGVPEDADLFGRSSFNRYYYALFLTVRSFIKEFSPDWQAGHASVPDFLTGSVMKEIKNFRSSAMRRENTEAVAICNKSISALSALADIMRRANTVRVTADYNPDIKIHMIDDGRFSLNNTEITDAHSWAMQARTFCQEIRRAWRLSRGIA
ncbi:hypothetical protein GG804_25445 [Sphingomonas histidinilytica]|uniref:hypothetical protein n=1 Tax=Rhizorhabdus histidinilytica TaxID=439228 RepID=UPI001ADC2FD4|nr:hypothetical protein [Rhizorhabdus histidinilytica]MBO9380117.1 hypothetical protein [Rhizorhabdus histidinilytica]